MGFADRIEARVQQRQTTCGYAQLLSTLDPKDAEDLEHYMSQSAKEVPSTWIYEELHADGHKLGETQVRRHRKGDCSCQ